MPTATPARAFISKRTESDMLAMSPIKVRLGHADYEIAVLNNRKAKDWREKFYAALAPVVADLDFGGIDLNAAQEQVSKCMSSKLSQELIAFPARLAELLLAFASATEGNTITQEIIDDATDEQIQLAFAQVAEIGYPFFFHLWATKRALAHVPAIPIPTAKAAIQ